MLLPAGDLLSSASHFSLDSTINANWPNRCEAVNGAAKGLGCCSNTFRAIHVRSTVEHAYRTTHARTRGWITMPQSLDLFVFVKYPLCPEAIHPEGWW